MKRHHETKHKNLSNNYPLKSALRRSKLTELKSQLNSDGEFIKKNIAEVIAVLDSNNSKLRRLISQTPVFRHTVERRISRISANVEDKLQNNLANATIFSLALDESTDVTDNPQLAVYVCYVFSNVVVKEELLDLIALKKTTRGVDIKKALDEMLMKAKIPLNKFVSVATDGAHAMVGKIQD